MLEILLVVYLCKQLGKMLRAKGRSATGFQVLLVIAWIVGELGGGIVGVALTNSPGGMYLFALMGAAAGAATCFIIGRNLSSNLPDSPRGARGFPVTQPGNYP